jgi:hypothetical protein
MAGPFNYQPVSLGYQPRYAGTIIDLLQRQAEPQAEAAMMRGRLWGNALANVGNIVAGAVQQHQEQKTQQKREAMVTDAFNSWDPADPAVTYRKLAVAVGPREAMEAVKGFVSLQESARKQQAGEAPTIKETQDQLLGIGAIHSKVPNYIRDNYPTLREHLAGPLQQHFGLALPEQYDDSVGQSLDALYQQFNSAKPESGFSLKPGETRFDASGKQIASIPAAEKPEKTTVDQALMSAYQKGDQGEVSRLLNLKAREAAATRKPEEKEAPTDYKPDTRISPSGIPYLDVSQYLGKDRTSAQRWARANGVRTIGKQESQGLQDIETARANNRDIQTQMESFLPKDAAGRIIAGPENKLARYFQTNDQVAAFNSWRAGAIRTLRAMAGSSGLRINKAEVELAVQNDIPNITDTLGAAKQKMANVERMLSNAEHAILGGTTQEAGTSKQDFFKRHGIE